MNMKEEHEIIMYTSNTCGYCNKMKEELEVANIPYTLKDHKNFKKEWDKIMSDIHEQNGSWKTRKNYKSWEHLEF